MENTNPPTPAAPQFRIDENMVRAKIENYKLEQNLGLGIIGGAIGGLLGAAAWAAITYFTEYQIGWIAIIVGFLVGFGVRTLGKGIDKIYGIIGGVIALGSVLLGNFLASMGFLAKGLELSFLDTVLGFNYRLTFELLKETFSMIDLVFYGLAVYAGYRNSFRNITKAQLLEGAVTRQDSGQPR
ncbi:MAG TPA: hypothetical protein PLA25_01125 [Anaerolineaceae bacterium]|jgi:hypothetical protein|nr:hypothetical protein [Longilinea sp.]HQN42705.1 hypothetical protein [Anaerolineaceae bacterium]